MARQHEKTANQRKDFLNKLSTNLIRNYDVICIEDLQIKNMVKNHNLAQAISDEVKEIAKTLINHTFKLDFEIPDKSTTIQTSIVDIVKQRLDDREVEPIEVEGYFLKEENEDTIIIHNRFDILGQKTEISIYVKYDIKDNDITIRKAY